MKNHVAFRVSIACTACCLLFASVWVMCAVHQHYNRPLFHDYLAAPDADAGESLVGVFFSWRENDPVREKGWYVAFDLHKNVAVVFYAGRKTNWNEIRTYRPDGSVEFVGDEQSVIIKDEKSMAIIMDPGHELKSVELLEGGATKMWAAMMQSAPSDLDILAVAKSIAE